jgi:FKBP-type peptidyl-prolyl cis-trans isomerase FkpA
MKQNLAIFSIAVLGLLAGCSDNAGYKATKSGVRYKIVEKGSGPAIKYGDFIKFHTSEIIGDTLLSTPSVLPGYMKVDSVGDLYNPIAVLGKLSKGDSCNIVLELDSLIKDPNMFPPFAKPGDKYFVNIRVLDILADEEAVNTDREMLSMELQEKEDQELVAFLQSQNIDAQKTEGGSYYVITEKGNGPAAADGKKITINYTGKTLDGTVFDSNVDPSFNHPTPFTFEMGSGMVVRGWDETLRNFKKGDKGILYIPSKQGYGAYPPPGSPFKGFQTLMFEVEVLDVTDK